MNLQEERTAAEMAWKTKRAKSDAKKCTDNTASGGIATRE